MTDTEAIIEVREGRRVQFEHSVPELDPSICPGFNHDWRVMACNSRHDVVECRRCGRQSVVSCNFDEEYS